MEDEYHRGMVTVHLYFVGVENLETEYPNWLMRLKQKARQQNGSVESRATKEASAFSVAVV